MFDYFLDCFKKKKKSKTTNNNYLFIFECACGMNKLLVVVSFVMSSSCFDYFRYFYYIFPTSLEMFKFLNHTNRLESRTHSHSHKRVRACVVSHVRAHMFVYIVRLFRRIGLSNQPWIIHYYTLSIYIFNIYLDVNCRDLRI